MKLHSLAGIALTLISSAVLAQSATPAIPATPATPATPSSSSDKDKNPVTVTPSQGDNKGGTVSTDNGSLSGSVNPNAQSGSVAGNATTGNQDFGRLDLDGSGTLSRDELKTDTKLLARFGKLDSNHDGKLDSKEYALINSTTLRNPTSTNSSTSKSTTRTKEKDDTKDTDDVPNQPGDVLPGG
jgi:hypothetical protein